MSLNNLVKRLETIEKEIYRDVWADVTYKDGTKQRLRLLNILSRYTNGETMQPITAVTFIGDVSRQGILPVLAKYLVGNVAIS